MSNVVIDMNNMLFRSMHVLGGFSGGSRYTFESEKELAELMRKITMDMTYLIRLINPSRVIFAVDDKSWRKCIKIEENEGYKGHRKHSDSINWDNIFAILDEFLEIVENHGMIVTKIKSAEADDIIALWRDELLYNQEQHVIAISGDEDIRQLVKSHITKSGKKIFSTVFNPFMQGKNAARKLYVPEGEFIEWLNTEDVVDIWNMSASIDIDKGDFRRIRDTEKVRIEEVNGNLIAMRKVFCGDDGDNIPAMYTWMSETANGTPKELRLTNSKFEKILEDLQNTPDEIINHNTLLERKDKIFAAIKKISKQTPNFKIEDRLNRQIKLVVLDKTLFPTSILTEFDELKESLLLKDRPDIGNLNMNMVLQGTKYVKAAQGGTGKGNELSIFKQIDRLTNTQLF